MLAALLLESVILPHWLPVRWIPQISFLIFLFASLGSGVRAGVILGGSLGAAQAFLNAMPGLGILWVYAGLGLLAGASKNVIFLESPLAQWLAPVGFGILAELLFFWMMPWDEAPLGWGDFWGLLRASNLGVTCLLSGMVYGFCRRAVCAPARR